MAEARVVLCCAWRGGLVGLGLLGCGGGSSDSTGPGPTGPVATVEVSPGSPTVLTDDQVTLNAKLKDANGGVLSGRTVTWSSDNESVATVSAGGVVTPVIPGDVAITATSEGKSGAATVAVRVRFVQVAVNYGHTCALTAAGAAWCWGGNTRGELGIGVVSDAPRLTPVPVVGGLRFKAIAAGVDHTCALGLDGAPWCWGANDVGQLGDGTQSPATGGTPSPTEVAGGHMFAQLAVGSFHNCALTSGGLAYCWGDNSFGAVNGAPSSQVIAVPTPVPAPAGLGAPLTFVAIRAGFLHTCAAATDMDNAGLWCWGNNSWGQLGRSPGLITGLVEVGDLVRAGQLSTGGVSTCAVGQHQLDAQAFEPSGMCWGGNDYGQLQDPDPATLRTFPGLQGALAMASGVNFGCLVQPTGVLECWGYNEFGQLGRDSPDAAGDPQPAPVKLNATFSRVYAGSQSSSACAISSEGLVYCWGANYAGQLGDGTAGGHVVPTLVSGQQ